MTKTVQTWTQSQVSARLATKRVLRFFVRAEEGTLIVFALVLFVLMTMLGGIAVDLMRYEAMRTTLQNTLDRATLAAASLTQDLDAESVVYDYFDKAGLSEYLTGVTVEEGMNFKEVEATAMADTEPFFLNMIGIDVFEAPGNSTAEQRITNVEIVLVLDVSGSMQGTKLANMKVAAKEFIDSVLSTEEDGSISVSIVPYNAQVNLGVPLISQYNAVNLHGVANVNCLEIPAAQFGFSTLSRTLAIPMSAFADMASSTSQVTSYVSHSGSSATPNTNQPYCRNTAANIVRLPGQNGVTLKSQIDGLVADGNTSIMLGMKWGLTLTDPDARAMFSEFVLDGVIDPEFEGRPFDYSDDSMKVIVLMTDGEHTVHTIINNTYKTGNSIIYKSTGDGYYSAYHATYSGSNKYWVPHLSAWQAAPYNSGAGVTLQTWQQVWASQRLSWVAWQLYARALGTTSSARTTAYNNAMNALRSNYGTVATMNNQLQQACSQAKTNGIIVYGIAFEAPSAGQTQISACATSTSHYFASAGADISTAFRSIASDISQLRLIN